MAGIADSVASAARRNAAEGRPSVVGRVIGLKGFSTLPVDELVLIEDGGGFHGELLGRHGREVLTAAAAPLLGEPEGRLGRAAVEIHGAEVRELGLACGGRAEVLLQPTAAIPVEFWDHLGARRAVGLVTVVDGEGEGASALVVDRTGAVRGSLHPSVPAGEVAAEAVKMLESGRTGSQRVETSAGTALIETWVPSPRLAVIGSGEMISALEAQAGLLGWEVRASEDTGAVEGLLDWAGASGALVVLSHDPHVDVPALAAGLARDTAYIGAMGSRGTQSRRIDRLVASGVDASSIERIHRPIGLNLGGRRAAEVALAIVAEILAVHNGRDAQPLRATDGPIHG